MGVVSPQLLPDWAVLDGALTCGVNQLNTAATGIDAMVHAVEAYTSKVLKNPFSDTLAKEALRLLSKNIERVCLVDGTDVNARSDMLLGSMYAGMAFANAPVAAVHALAYPIGSNFQVAHGMGIYTAKLLFTLFNRTVKCSDVAPCFGIQYAIQCSTATVC